MLNFDELKQLNDRSRSINGPMKAIFIKCVDGEGAPYITYRTVNAKSKGYDRIPILNFVAKLATMEFYAVNIESLGEMFDCYDIVGAELSIKASYSSTAGLLYVSAFDALIATFLTYELLEDDAVENMIKKVAEACQYYRIPLGVHGKDIIENEINRCISEEFNAEKPMPIGEYRISKWLMADKLFDIE
ncbi:MAG: hypothetical protein K6C95_11350, partial [Lachnospiraceae bacterium]|nr:hypothetical protein [Lachnospiraceae bacterium]